MTATAPQPRPIRRERRIIERPRLIKLLDETDAHTILLLAPAGYGKTTLLRQWVKTLNGSAFLTLTAGHRDVATLVEDLAAAMSVDADETRFVREYVRARSNPQREAHVLGQMLCDLLVKHRTQWIVLDDYHEVSESRAASDLIEAIHQVPKARFVIGSRTRPGWATSRRVIYGDVAEITREALAMDDDESKEVLGKRPGVSDLIRQSQGWPAVLGLASTAGALHAPGTALPAALYDYFADELFRSAPEWVQARLLELALACDLSYDVLQARYGDPVRQIVAEARELGFLSVGETLELHPLLREFLLQKLAEGGNAEAAVRSAVSDAVRQQRWDKAFELILRFRIHDEVENVLELGFRPLVRSGRVGTLSSFSSAVRAAPTFPPPVVDLVEAEVALRDGAFSLASEIAERVIDRLPEQHGLRSRSHAIVAQSAYIRGDLKTAELAFELAHGAAREDSDVAEALYGWALASLQGEQGDATWIMSALAKRRHQSPLDLLRYATAEIVRRHFSEGFAKGLSIDEGLHVVSQVDDPRARSSFNAIGAYCVALTGDYGTASSLIQSAIDEIDAFDLDFARPHAWWTRAFIDLGRRKFGACERSLQRVEDAARDKPVEYHILNARILRARLALQTAQIDEARDLVTRPATEAAIPSIHAEYLGTRALVLASTGELDDAISAAASAEAISTAVETRVLAQAARAIVSAETGDPTAAEDLWAISESLGTWDPVIAATRASPKLAKALSDLRDARPRLAALYQSSHDLGLARQAGLRTRNKREPDQLLSPREREVLELLARGFRNKDVSEALVIAPSTTKVHVRNILEKLGVHTRTEAVARFTAGL